MKKMKNIIIIIFVGLVLGIAGTFYVQKNLNSQKQFVSNMKPMNLEMPDIEKIIKKIKVTDVLVENILNKAELVTVETSLKQNAIWDDSFSEWEIFKKEQRITAYATGKFSTDLSEINQNDINFDYDLNKVTIAVPKPEISSIEIHDENTEVYSTENGLLRFGEMKISALEQKELYKKIKTSMEQKLNEKDIIETAEENTKQSVSNLFTTFLTSADMSDINIDIVFKE